MRKLLLSVSFALLAAGAASAQDASTGEVSTGNAAGGSATLSQLLSRGYEIKTAVPNGKQFILFLQKDQSAYACEFATVAKTRCGSLN